MCYAALIQLRAEAFAPDHSFMVFMCHTQAPQLAVSVLHVICWFFVCLFVCFFVFFGGGGGGGGGGEWCSACI